MLRERPRLQLPERLSHLPAHARVRVIEHRNEGGTVLRERPRLQLPERLHHRLAHTRVRVLEHRNEGSTVLRERLGLQLPECLHHRQAHARSPVYTLDEQNAVACLWAVHDGRATAHPLRIDVRVL